MRPITELTGRYHLLELIAAGGMGEVWRAVDQSLDRPVAVKLLRPEYSRDEVTLLRFRAEARHAGGLNHPGIAQVYDYQDASPDRPAFLVMELVNGPSLAGVLAGGRLDAQQTADVLAQAATALQVAHAAGIMHRDIKPGNLLISQGSQIKVTDFGVAQSPLTGHLTRTGSLIGTTGYLAPERVSGRAATAASDLYALGIVGYECLTGHPPFRGEPLAVALAHRDQELPALPPRCLTEPGGAEVAALISSLTAKDPAARPASAALVAEEAGRIRDSLGGERGGSLAATGAAPTRPDQAGGPPSGAPDLSLITDPDPAGDGPLRTWASATGGQVPPAVPGRPREARRPRRGVAAGLAGGIAAAGLLGWLLATVLADPPPGPAPAGQVAASHPAATPARSAASVRTVTVGTALLGRPVSVVRRELRRLGLVVEVRPRRDEQAAPGSVVQIYPTGQVAAGSVVLVTAATWPARSAPAPAPANRATPGDPATPAGPAASATASPKGTKPTPPGHAKHSKGPPPGHG